MILFSLKKQLYLNKRWFGHGLNRDATWIKYKSDPKLIELQLVQDIYGSVSGPVHIDPYQHIKKRSIFSLENLVMGDAFYHQPQEDPLNQEQHGYYDGTDPLDMRYDFMPAASNAVIIITTLILVYSYLQRPKLKGPRIRRAEEAINYVEEEIQKKREIIQELQRQKQELFAQLRNSD